MPSICLQQSRYPWTYLDFRVRAARRNGKGDGFGGTRQMKKPRHVSMLGLVLTSPSYTLGEFRWRHLSVLRRFCGLRYVLTGSPFGGLVSLRQ